MDAAYFKAAIPDPVRIFGLELLPLSITRYRFLRRFGCSFVDDGPAMATIEDLILGVLICSMRCKEFLEFVGSREFVPELEKWGKRIQEEVRADPFFNLLYRYELFKNYIAESYRQPLYWEERQDDRVSGAHWSHNLECVLRSELGWSQDEIDEAPLSKALADFFKHCENQGAIRLMTPEEIEQVQANAKLEAQLAQQGAAAAPVLEPGKDHYGP